MIRELGFSLIEVLIAATIFMIGMLALAGLQYSSITLTGTSNNRFAATSLVQQVMEAARSEGVGRFNPTAYGGSFDALGHPAADGTGRVFTRQVTVSGNTITVQVSWNERGEVKHVSASSFIY